MNTVKCPYCNGDIDVNTLNIGVQQFLVKGETLQDDKTVIKYFGPFKSQKMAEQTVAKVCGGFDSVDLLCKNQKTGEIKSLTVQFLEE